MAIQFRKATVDGELYVNAKDVTRELGIRVQNVYKWSEQRESIQVSETYIPAKHIPEKHRKKLGIEISEPVVEVKMLQVEPDDSIPMKTAMELCGRKSKDYRLYFERYAKDQSRSPMYLTQDELERMKSDLIFVNGQITVDEVAPNIAVGAPNQLSVDEILEALRSILAGRNA